DKATGEAYPPLVNIKGYYTAQFKQTLIFFYF
ncbi:GSCOCG00012798001-RA-CDS, partial [Cotesia congregata]